MIKRLVSSGLLFLCLLLTVNYLHFRFFDVDVVFYGALLDVFLSSVFAVAVSWRCIFRRAIPPAMLIQQALIFLLAGYVYAISVPTVIDRSLSIYIIEKLQQRGGGIRQASFEKVFTEEYVKEHRLVDVRLTEQVASGTVVIRDGCVLLTDRGRAIAAFTRWYRTHLLPPHRLLMGQYTDALTDPFRRSSAMQGYECGPQAAP